MNIRAAVVLAVVTPLAMTHTAFAQVHTQRGAVVGGLSGAAIGAIIGDHNDEAGAGAAIGGVIGAVAGGVLGNANDQQSYRSYPQYSQPVAVHPVQVQRVVTPSDVVAMTQSRVSDAVIISAIQSNGISHPLDVQDIVYLSQQGVSDPVIRVMQNAGISPVIVARPVAPPRTVVIDHYPSPVYHYSYPSPRYHHYHTGHHGPTRSGASISFGGHF